MRSSVDTVKFFLVLTILSLISSTSPSRTQPILLHSLALTSSPMYSSLYPRSSVQDSCRTQGWSRPLPGLNEAEQRFSECYLDLFFSVSKWQTCCSFKSFEKSSETKQPSPPTYCKMPGAYTQPKPEHVSCYPLEQLAKKPKIHTFPDYSYENRHSLKRNLNNI